MNFITGRYGCYPTAKKVDPIELQKRLAWLKEMEKSYCYIERFARENLFGDNSPSCDYWAFGTGA